MNPKREEILKHLAASLKDAKEDGGAILLVGAGISVSAGIPPAQKLMKIAIENFPNYFTDEEQKLAQEDLSQLQYNDIMTKLSNVKRKELFKWFIEGNKEKGIKKAKLNFAHIAIAELLKQGYFSRILTVNFDPLLIHACYMVGMYPFPAIYDLGAMGKVNAELLHDPSIVYLNGQHVGFVQRNTTDQLEAHKETLSQIVRSTGCNKTWVVAGYSGENDPLMDALNELRPYNNWLYWLEYNEQVLQKESHQFLENDEECKTIYSCDADETFMEVAENLKCSLDFIERPHKELELYLSEINFNSLGKRGSTYQIKISEYIKILKSDQKQLSFLTIDIANILIDSFADLVEEDEKIIEICNLILKQFPDHEEALSWLAFSYHQLAYKYQTRQEYFELAFKIYEQIIQNYPQRIEDYKFYVETLFDKLRNVEEIREQKKLLDKIKTLIDKARTQHNFKDPHDELVDLNLKRIKLLNDLEPYQPQDS